MPITAQPRNGSSASLHSRRQKLFELHSFLRSVDNLRPDEALDEIAKLFELWTRSRSFDGELAPVNSLLSDRAAAGAIERLTPILGEVQAGHGGDLFQELADVGVRAGMGQYFTPAPAAEAIAAFMEPSPGEKWLDPFCGSALLLGALPAAARGDVELYGIDRDPRVLHLARVEAALHHPTSELSLLHANALEDPASLLQRLGAPSGGVDGIVTNPPFGAEIHEVDRAGYAPFELAKGKTALEILGLEQSIALVRPGGQIAIVLPQSVLSNRSLAEVRRFVLERCWVQGVLSLPPETFGPFGGVGKASVLFLQRRSGVAGRAVMLGVSRSIGWDAGGKPQGTPDVAQTTQDMLRGVNRPRSVGTVPQSEELARNMTAEWGLRPAVRGRRLGDLCSAIFSGSTPGRAAYENAGGEAPYRVLKVADLTNRGIDWSVGDRSLAALRRRPSEDRMVMVGDLAMTAAAHHPRYIGAKVDYVDCLPDGFAGRSIPVAEVMILRPRPNEVDPIVLLLWLRSDEGREAIQSCVTGQTAHLHADDLADVIVREAVFEVDLTDAVEAVRLSLRLRRESEQASDSAVRLFSVLEGLVASTGRDC